MTPDAESFPPDHPVSHARRVLHEEAEALIALAARLNTAFASAVDLLTNCKGRVVVTGMGKSGHIGRKIAATLASTGTPALFLHPAEAVHGDLGMVATGDAVLALSYSGETDELLAILPALRRRSEALIAITGNVRSSLARAATVVLDVCVPKEACPMNLAPMTSTTAMIALGDSLAVAVMEARGFGHADYALLHPAGSLGRRLLMRVEDVMRTGAELAIVEEATTLFDTMLAITRAGAGAACVIDSEGRLTGLLTEGDTRRYVLKVGPSEAFGHPVADAMTRAPRMATPDQLAVEALDRFEHDRVKFSEMPVVDTEGHPVGMLMLKDLIRTGIVLPDVNAG